MKLINLALLVLLIWAHPAHADPLQDRLEAAIEAFGGIVPDAPDVGLGWADLVISGAVSQANPSQVIRSDQIGDWLLANQPTNIDDQLRQRAEWVASTFKQAVRKNTKFETALLTQQISVAELQLRITAAVDKVTPGPSQEELRLMEKAAERRTAKTMKEMAKRRAAKAALEQQRRQWGEVQAPDGVLQPFALETRARGWSE